jgi:hypothetical protein
MNVPTESGVEKLKSEIKAANAETVKAHPAETGLGVAVGALAGGLIGAAGGPLTAFIGAGIGAVAGGNTGYEAAEEKSDRDSREKGGEGQKTPSPTPKGTEFDIPGNPHPGVRDSLDTGGFSSGGQHQKD